MDGVDAEKAKPAAKAYRELPEGFCKEYHDMMWGEQYESAKNDPESFVVLIQLAYYYQAMVMGYGEGERTAPFFNWKLFTRI